MMETLGLLDPTLETDLLPCLLGVLDLDLDPMLGLLDPFALNVPIGTIDPLLEVGKAESFLFEMIPLA